MYELQVDRLLITRCAILAVLNKAVILKAFMTH